MIYKIGNFISKHVKKERNFIILAISTGILSVFAYSLFSALKVQEIQRGIAGEVVRFHVLANSDEDFDQKLKLEVRDEILKKYEKGLSNCSTKAQTEEFINENLTGIELCAKEVIERNGYNYPVKASLTNSMFPRRTYGDATFPGGEYEALRVVIGEGKGANWWCMMFPPLCYVDITKKELPPDTKEELKNILTVEEYNEVLPKDKIVVKFKIVEVFEDLFGSGDKNGGK